MKQEREKKTGKQRRIGQATSNKKRQRLVKKRRQPERKPTVTEQIKSYLPLVILLGLTVCFFLAFKTRQVDGVSMVPTLEDKERLLVRRTTTFNRYNLITFEPADKPGESYVKRIIGLPGDHLHLEGNHLYLSSEDALSLPEHPEASQLPDGTIKVLVSPEVVAKLQNLTTIPQGEYFVLGDNRNHSRDSREMGLINAGQIEGRVVFRYFPLTKMGGVS